MNKYLLSLTICIFIVSSCASVEVTTNNVKNEKESPLEVDENQKFLDFLEIYFNDLNNETDRVKRYYIW